MSQKNLNNKYPYDLTVITAVKPDRSQFLPETAASIQELRNILNVQWIVCWDGIRPQKTPDATYEINGEINSGISATRNLALPHIKAPFTTPLDADDLIVSSGCLKAIQHLKESTSQWVGLNRILLSGEKTSHWKDNEKFLPKGSLALNWSAPFEFHPNSFIIKTELLKEIGGWPALSCNEDLGLVLYASEKSDGIFIPSILTKYRVWDGQEVQSESYIKRKYNSFSIIESIINQRRENIGATKINSPVNPGGAWGVINEAYSKVCTHLTPTN